MIIKINVMNESFINFITTAEVVIYFTHWLESD